MNSFFETENVILDEINLRKTHTLWVEKYRPLTLDTFISDEPFKKQIAEYIKNNDIPHLLFYGNPGCGKSTIANIIVKNMKCDYMYINASDENGIDVVRDKIKTFAHTASIHDLKIIILDEADYMTVNGQSALRSLMEEYSQYTRFILTGNYVEKIIDPIISRCQVFNLFSPNAKSIFGFILEILKSESIKFESQDVVFYVKQLYPDIRKIVNTIQKQSITGVLIKDEIAVSNSDVKNKLIGILKNKTSKQQALTDIRQLLLNNNITDFTEFYTFLYSKVEEISNDKMAQIVVTLAEYQYQSAFVVDKEINFMACIIKILNII